ncbi:MAG: nucleoside-triphosphatase [Candidatus Hodarchaeales archaeon]|jgi:nucleoside-triphosphatase THEP1
MIGDSFIITGRQNAGKSTLCWQVLEYLNNQAVSIGGVITLQNDKKWFYLIAEDSKIPFEANETEEFIPIGRFRIHKVNFEYTISSIKANLDSDYLFIDEIGLLELQGSGYFPIINAVLSREQGNILVVRENLLDDFSSHFPQANTYKIFHVENRETSSALNTIKKHINQ